MKSETKKALNRAGLGMMILGLVLFAVGGGNLDTATGLVGTVFSAIGTAGVLAREIGGLFK